MNYHQIISECNPSQSHWELNQLLNLIEDIDIHHVLEIGVHLGGSLDVWRRALNPVTLIGINNIDEYQGDKKLVEMIEGDSHIDETKAKAEKILNGRKLDFLFIDGDHTFEGVMKDFMMYSPLVREGGVIGFHDVILEGNDTCGVYKFWKYIRENHQTVTIWDGTPSGTGEGLMYV